MARAASRNIHVQKTNGKVNELTFQGAMTLLKPGADPRRERRAEDQRQPHPDRVAHERRKSAAHQHAVEAPKPLLAVFGWKSEEVTRHRRDDHAQQSAPAYKPLAFDVSTPENTDHEQQSGPRAVLKHHLPRAAQQDLDEIQGTAGPSGLSDCICHTFNV